MTPVSVRAAKTSAFWTARKVAWYQRANEASDYAARVLDAAADLLAGSRTALDVGAGFGALALPLARRMAHVTAVEPSRAMARALGTAAAREGLQNLVVREAAWDEVAVVPHDVVICAHVSPLLEPGSAFLSVVSTVARRGVVLVRDVPGGQDKFFFGELYPRLLGRPYEHGCANGDPLASLGQLGITPRVTPIEYASDQPFESLEEACDFWMDYMTLRAEEARVFLRAFLARRLERRGTGWVAPFRKRAAVVQWRIAPTRGRG